MRLKFFGVVWEVLKRFSPASRLDGRHSAGTLFFVAALAAALAATALASFPALAQTDDDEEIKVRSIMVTTNRVLQELFTSPMSVSVITSEDLEREPYSNILDALKNLPGVILDSSSAAIAGAGRIAIRGENTGRTLFLINGIKAVDKENAGGTLMITPSQVERIEVIKGPASVLYGPEAIGGVVNVITKKGGGKPVSFSQNFVFDTSTESVDIQSSLFGSYKGFNYRVSGSGINAKNRKVPKNSNDGAEAYDSNYRTRNYSIDLGYDWEKNSVNFRYDRFENKSFYSNSAAMSDQGILMWLDPNDRDTYSGTLVLNDITSYLAKVTMAMSYQIIKRDVVSDFNNRMMGPVMWMRGDVTSEQKQHTSSLQTDWRFGPHYLIAGVEFEKNIIEVETVTAPYTAGRGEMVANAKLKQDVLGVFAQDQWSITNNLTSTLGMRFTDVNLKYVSNSGDAYVNTGNSKRKDSRLVTSAGLVFTGIDNWALRAQFSQGYRYPTARQLFTGSPGHGGGPSAIQPNPDLKPETSNNYELGARFINANWDFDLALFYSDAKQLIQTTQAVGAVPATYINYDKAETKGVEASIKYTFDSIGLSPYATGTWMSRKVTVRGGESTKKTRNPPYQGRVGVKWDHDFNEDHHFYADLHVDMASKTKSNIQESMTATAIRAVTTTYPAWQNVSLTIGARGGRDHKYNVSLSIRNIFDQQYSHSRGSDSMPEAGLHAVLGVGFEY
jgi:hemoglobin/transferrin/lactoferrin receptor protein